MEICVPYICIMKDAHFSIIALLWTCGALQACASKHAESTTETDLGSCDVEPEEARDCEYHDDEVIYGSRDTVKVCQLTGDFDRHTGEPTLNRTGERFALKATDLGASFLHQDKTWFLFGDSSHTCDDDTDYFRWEDPDAIAWSTDVDPTDCIALDFVTHEDASVFLPPHVDVPEAAPALHMSTFEVPIEGISGGDAEGDPIYMWFGAHIMTVSEYLESGAYEEDDLIPMDRSILAKTGDGGRSFEFIYEFSTRYFVNVSAEVTAPIDLLPEGDGDRVLLFGTGEYRNSDVYLATVSLTDLEDRDSLRYFAGRDDNNLPIWTDNEFDSSPLLELPDTEERCVGEISVQYNVPLERWVMLYNCNSPKGINMRTARNPWGPWSETQVIFHPRDDAGYCEFIHSDWASSPCDCVHDEGRSTGDGTDSHWGGAYAPYMVPGMTTDLGDGRAEIYFLMSTWNPYQVMLMRSVIQAID